MAAKYRKIDPRIWYDEKFRTLSREEKLVAIYCLTAQSNRIGMFRFSEALAAEDLDMPQETFRKCFRRVCHAFGWQFDEAARVLLIRKWFRYNQPDNPNVLKSCLEDLHDVPQTSLISAFRSCIEFLPQPLHEVFLEAIKERCGYAATSPETLPETFPKTLPGTLPQTFLKRSPQRYPKQEQEQEQELEQEQEQEQEIVSCSETQPCGEIGRADSPLSPAESLDQSGVPEDVARLTFPCDGPVKEWKITSTVYGTLQQAFQSIDISAELRKAYAWLVANPGKRKTAKGMARFLFNWMARCVDQNGPRIAGNGSTRLPGLEDRNLAVARAFLDAKRQKGGAR